MRSLPFRWLLSLCVGLVLLWMLPLGGWQDPRTPPQEPPQQPIFRTGVNLVRVDVSVTDGRGRPVLDLTRDDFEVSEDGVPQVIDSFKLVGLSGELLEGEDLSLPIRSVQHAAAEAARDDIRLFAVFLDDYHVTPGRNTLAVREALTRFVRNNLGSTDLTTIMDPLTPLSALRFTRDRWSLLDRIKKFEGRRGIYTPPRSVLEEEQLRAGNVLVVRAQVTLSALEALVTHLGSLREGRKAVLIVSQGVPTHRETMPHIQSLLQAANRNNAALYGFDPSGLGGRTSAGADTLMALAANTGGRAVINTNSLDRGLVQVVSDSSAFYLLGYASSQSLDGKYHRIRVEVKRRGTSIHARHGYWAPSVADMERAAAVARDKPPDEVSKALASLDEPRSRSSIHTWIGTARASDGTMRLTFAWEPRSSTNGADKDQFHVRLKAASDDTTYFEGEAPKTEAHGTPPLSFTVNPGPLTLTVTLENGQGELVDKSVRTLEIADLTADRVAIGTPRLYLVRNSLDLRQLASNPNVAPKATQEFDRRDRLRIRFDAYAREQSTLKVTAQLLSRKGRTLVDLPVVPSGANGPFEIDVQLSSLAAGDYVVRIDANGEDAKATEHVAIRVR